MALTKRLVVLSLCCACGPSELIERELDEEVVSAEAELTAIAPAPPCTAVQLAEVLEAAKPGKASVEVNCSVTLTASQTVTKRLTLTGPAANGVTFDCGGAALTPTQPGEFVIAISSVQNGTVWQRPEGITFKNCRVTGPNRVWGLGKNGQGPLVKASSWSLGHTQRAQAAAPRNIVFQHMTLVGTGGSPLYLGPGVTFFKLLDSDVGGVSNSVGVYLDAESAHNTFRNTSFHVATQDKNREQVAVDGSADNSFVGNRFAGLNHGGVYLYRNCGEGGTVRHQSPRRNDFIGNVFVYVDALGLIDPAVHVGSRNLIWPFIGYCGLDEPPNTPQQFTFGSAASNFDFAEGNVLAQNQVIKRSPSVVFRIDDSPTFQFDNESVTAPHAVTPGCVLRTFDGRTVYLKDQESFVTRTSANASVASRYRCANNVLTVQANLATTTVPFGCSVTNSNSGCAASVLCPGGQRLVGLRAAMNLETTSLASTAVTETAWDQVRVVRASDFVFDGEGKVGSVSLRSGAESLSSLLGRVGSTTATCSEFDFNGGDCVVRGEALCL